MVNNKKDNINKSTKGDFNRKDNNQEEFTIEKTNEISNEMTDDNADIELIASDETLSVEKKLKDKTKLLHDKLQDCESEKRKIRENEQRTRADFLNAKRRLEDELKQKVVKTKNKFVADLLPLCDSFESAMNDGAWDNVDSSWKQGVEGIYSQLQQLLRSYQVESFSPLGEDFDPNLHEAIGVRESIDESQNNTVVEVVQCGYKIKVNDKGEAEILRPARVITGSVKP